MGCLSIFKIYLSLWFCRGLAPAPPQGPALWKPIVALSTLVFESKKILRRFREYSLNPHRMLFSVLSLDSARNYTLDYIFLTGEIKHRNRY